MGMRILVVDDEAASRTKMQTLMWTFGECVATEHGSEAIKLFEEALTAGRAFQLITLDIEMPDLSGTEVLQRIRRIESDHQVGPDQRTKIIMVTGRSDKDQVVACVHCGCDAYIAKPFNLQLVRAKMEKIGLGGNNPKANAPPKAATPQPVSADTIFNDISQALRKGDLELPMQP
ncbi:MAG: response regulator, partial [Desulfatitalea sp.]